MMPNGMFASENPLDFGIENHDLRAITNNFYLFTNKRFDNVDYCKILKNGSLVVF